MRWLSQLVHAWKRLQVTYYGGKYSIHRLLALEAYTQNTSLVRVLLVCVGTPFPMAAFVSIQALIPLQDPTEGWSVNYGFWIRSGILSFVVAHTLTTQAIYLIDEVDISAVRLVLVSACASVIFTAFAVSIAAVLIFPVPFFVLTLTPLFYVALVLSYCFVLDYRTIRQVLEKRGQLIMYISYVATQNSMAFVYPAYEALFRVAKGSAYQLPVVLLLPLVKVAVKNLVLRCMSSKEDMLPEAVIFTVDFFNSVYVATCMQSSTSVSAIIAITITDLSQTVLMLFSLHQRTATIIPSFCHSLDCDNLIGAICSVCRDPKKFERQERASIHIHSCLPLKLSTENKELLGRLENISMVSSFESDILPKLNSSSNLRPITLPEGSIKRKIHNIFVQKRSGTIRPLSPVKDAWTVKTQPLETLDMENENISTQRSSPILRDALEALFTTECIVTAAYLETIVPLFYCCYMAVMVHLPSARYHTEMTEVTLENVGETILPVFVFGLLQIATFLMLGFVIKRNCGMGMVYQLAFVLEMQMPLIQGKLILWLLVMLCFRVVHFGVDFTFQFRSQRYTE